MKKINIVAIASTFLIYSCGDHPKQKNPLGEPDVIAVKTAPLSSYTVPGTIHASGLVSTENEANYAFKIGGVISRVFVEEGQFFRKGQVLATLNVTEIAAGLAQSDLGVAKAQRDYDRAINLYRDSVFTLEQLQNTRTALDLARKSKEAVAFNERYAKIYAASDGFVTKKIASEGEVVAGGMPVLLTNSTVANGSYILKVGVTDLEWSAINVGQSAKVSLDGYIGQQFDATVSKKLRSADREIGSFQVELRLKLDKVTPPVGMFGKAEIATDSDGNAVIIPYSSLVEADGDKGFIYTTVGSDKVKKIPVHILRFENKRVYLRDRLEGIVQIVVSNSAFLNEQSIIKIIK